MNIRESDDDGIYISGQISVADLPALVKAGIRTIICNRPDGEAKGQPGFMLIQQAAARYGMHFHYIPVTSAGITEKKLHEMIAILAEAERPLLAYCQSGNRSHVICSLAKKHLNET